MLPSYEEKDSEAPCVLNCVILVGPSREIWRRGKGLRCAEFLVCALEKLHILPDRLLLVRVTQQVGGVEGRQDRDLMIVVKPSAQFRDRLLSTQQRLSRNGTQHTDQFGLDNLKLREQERLTCGDLIRLRVAIGWRPTLDDVTDVDLLAGQLHRLDDPGQQLPRFSYKRLALLVFVRPWCLSHKEEPCLWIADPKDDSFSTLV